MSAPRPLVIVGAGGFGREVVDLVRDVTAAGTAYDVLGLLGDTAPEAEVISRLGVAWLGPTGTIALLPSGTAYVVAVADAVARERLAAQADVAGLEAVTLQHPSAVVGTDVRIAPASSSPRTARSRATSRSAATCTWTAPAPWATTRCSRTSCASTPVRS